MTDNTKANGPGLGTLKGTRQNLDTKSATRAERRCRLHELELVPLIPNAEICPCSVEILNGNQMTTCRNYDGDRPSNVAMEEDREASPYVSLSFIKI